MEGRKVVPRKSFDGDGSFVVPPASKRSRLALADKSNEAKQVQVVPSESPERRRKKTPALDETDDELMALGLHRLDEEGDAGSSSGRRKNLPGKKYAEPSPVFSFKKPEPRVQSRPSTAGPSYFASLPDELVIQILHWLPKRVLAHMALTCRRFSRLARDEVFWRRVDLGGRRLPPGVLGLLLLRGVTYLRCAKASFTSPVFLKPSKLISSKLQFLDLSVSDLALSDLDLVLGSCQRLVKLSMESLKLSSRSLSLVSQNSNLSVLHLAMCSGVTAAEVTHLLQTCSQLKELNLAWTNLDAASVEAVCRNVNSSMERLNLSGCRDTLQDSLVVTLTRRCPRLLELDVSDAVRLTGKVIHVILTNLTRLESLSTSRCYSITPVAYLAAAESQSLRYLNVFGVMKDAAFKELRRRLGGRIDLNQFPFSSIARPTVGIRRTSLWGNRVRDD